MAIRYLIDTCICIDIIRGRNRALLNRFRECGLRETALSTITLAELEFGVAKSVHPDRSRLEVEKFCVGVQVLPFDKNAAAVYGTLRADLQCKSITIGPLDLLIAAHALAEDAILVTNNEREFRRVPGLIVENWL